jgi:hypothetical protein
MAIDQEKLGAFLGKAIGDLGATLSAALVIIGEKLGLYKAMAGAGPMTSGVSWQDRTASAACGVAGRASRWRYVTHDAATGR